METAPKIYKIDPTKIYVAANRHRQLFNPKALADLTNSIKDIGQIEPIICHKTEKGLELIAGERRLRACETIGIDATFILWEEITDPLTLESIQLEENLVRADLDWKEEVLGKKRIFDILNTETDKKTVQSVGEYLGVSKATLSEDITLAIWLPENDEVAAAPNKATAKKIIKRLSTMIIRDKVLDESFREIQKKTAQPEVQVGEIASFALSPDKPVEESTLSIQETQMIRYDSKCLLGDMDKALLDFPDNHFDIVFFDPPWGVDYDKSQPAISNQQKYKDSLEEFQKSFPRRLKLLYKKMAENSHVYIFFGIVHYAFVHQTITDCGFKTSGIPLVWHKIGACRTRVADWDYGRCYEPIAFARKGLKKLNLPPSANIISTPASSPSLKDIHPSAKHPELYKRLLSQSGCPADKILDPTAGSGMMGVAAEELQSRFNFDWTLIEIDSDYRNLQLLNLSQGYNEIAHPKVQIKPKEEIEDFTSLSIGSAEWMTFWKAHPEKQDKMLAWRAKQN